MKRCFPLFASILVVATLATTASAASGTLYNLHKKPWTSYGEYAPKYNICTSCGGGVTYSLTYGISSPTQSGNSTKFHLGGSTPYSDALFTKSVIGHSNSLVPDPNHTIIPNLHNFTYDVYFFGGNLSLSQVLEFDISMYFGGHSLIFGTQCRVAGGHAWDIWDNPNSHWVSAKAPCYPISNGWNHLTIQVQRTSTGNKLVFKTITLNGKTSTINRTYGPNSAPKSWYGVTVNFQMDGNKKQSPYSVYLDKFTFKYW